MTDQVTRASVGRRLALLAVFAGGGAVSGVAAKLADGSVTWIGDLATYLAVWVFALAMIGAFVATPVQAALRAAVAFVSMCAGYYGFTQFALHYPVGREALVWTAVSLTVVPVLAAFVQFARAADRVWSGIVIGAVASLCLIDDAIARVVMAMTEQMPETFLASVRPVQAVINVLCALAIVVVVPRSRRTRWLAAVVAMVIGALGAPLLAELRSLVGV